MPKYQTVYNVKLNENITFNIEAASEQDALVVAEDIVFEILSTTDFMTENVQLNLDSIEAQEASYNPLISSEPAPNRNNDSGYTSLASLYGRNETPVPSTEDCCDHDCANQTPTYTRLT